VDDGGRHVLNTLLRVALEHGEAQSGVPIAELLRRAGDDRPVEVVCNDAEWSSYDQFRAALEVVAKVLGGPSELVNIYRVADAGGSTAPEAVELVQALGSPHALWEPFRSGRNPGVTFVETAGERTGDTEWVISTRFMDGFEPYPEFCQHSAGTSLCVLALFGIRDFELVEESCVLWGDEWCRHRVSWSEDNDLERDRDALRHRVSLLEGRIRQLQETVTDLVLAGDVERVLERVTTAAAASVMAPGFLLALDVELPGVTRSVYARGLDDEQAAHLAAMLRTGTGHAELTRVIDIASSRQHYGRLAVHDPTGTIRLDEGVLAAYARVAAAALDSAMNLDDARREASRANALLELSTSLADISTIYGVAQTLVRAVPTVIGADRAVVSLLDERRAVVTVAAATGYPDEVVDEAVGRSFPTTVEDDGAAVVYFDNDEVPPAAQDLLTEGAAAHVRVRLVVDGHTEGWLSVNVVDRPERLAPRPELEARLHGLAAQAAIAIRNARLMAEVRHQATHDALTGLPNRVLVLDRAEQMLSRAAREGGTVAALYFDLDGFKEINDSLGHAAGDRLLEAVGARLATLVRGTDTLGRLGGDEFVMLVAEGAAAPAIAERLLEAVRAPFELEPGHPVQMRASLGLALADGSATAESLLRDADAALYQAKAAGKDRVVRFSAA
jgi:diguanylate cyclase (GGDEF)-like protein